MTNPGARVGRPSMAEAARIESRILAAAWDVLRERGLEHFSIDQVAMLAQASKRTIYARFGSRAGLYRRMIEQRTAAFIEALGSQPRGPDLAETLAAQAIQVLAFVRSPEGRALAHLEERSPECEDAGRAPARRSIHERAILLVSDILRDAAPAGAVPADAIPDAATFWVAGLIGYGRIIVRDPGRIADDAAWARRHTALFLHGVLPDRS